MFVYIDETEGGARRELTAVAGYLFDRHGAEEFARLYRAKVEPLIPDDKRGRKIFHTAPCFDGAPPFDRISRPVRECILSRMAQAIKDSVTVGVVVGVEAAEYDAGLKGRYVQVKVGGTQVKNTRAFVGSKYSICLMRCVQGLNEWLDKNGGGGPIDYTMEAGLNPELEREAVTILSNVAASDVLSRKYRLGGYRFAPKGPDVPWLFAADYFAWVWQRQDRQSEAPVEEYGDWRSALIPLIDGKPHMGAYLSEASVNVHALVNSFHGLLKLRRDG